NLAAGDLAHRVPVEGDDEVADLARQFNDMAGALAEARRREHEFLANVSHELRTPLTAIRGYVEALGDGAVAGEAARADAVRVIGGMTVVTDPLRVRQILSNLVDNALRVTPAGGTVRVGRRRNGDELVVEVADTGPGISAEDLPHVFERSYLWGKSQKVLPVGTGLGLAIVRELAVALGGRIEVASEPGRGTAFALHLPAPSA